MYQVNEEILNPLLAQFRIGKKLAEALIGEMAEEMQKLKQAGLNCPFGTIRVSIARRHNFELKNGNDFGKAISLLDNYFAKMRSLRSRTRLAVAELPPIIQHRLTPAHQSRLMTGDVQLPLF